MDEPTLEAINLAIQTIEFTSQTVQLVLSLATGALALSITFAKEITPNITLSTRRYLIIAWFFYVLSIPFGIATMMALTGQLTGIDKILIDQIALQANPQALTALLPDIESSRVLVPAILQFMSFFLAILFTFFYGIRSLLPHR
jgi:hypothetical protein